MPNLTDKTDTNLSWIRDSIFAAFHETEIPEDFMSDRPMNRISELRNPLAEESLAT